MYLYIACTLSLAQIMHAFTIPIGLNSYESPG
eukprot:COSAG05_NODE_217_length_13794_cov_5.734064_11_plen_32_part_00